MAEGRAGRRNSLRPMIGDGRNRLADKWASPKSAASSSAASRSTERDTTPAGEGKRTMTDFREMDIALERPTVDRNERELASHLPRPCGDLRRRNGLRSGRPDGGVGSAAVDRRSATRPSPRHGLDGPGDDRDPCVGFDTTRDLALGFAPRSRNRELGCLPRRKIGRIVPQREET